MGTNDVLKYGKNFEQIFERDLFEQIKTCPKMYKKAEVRLTSIVSLIKTICLFLFENEVM